MKQSSFDLNRSTRKTRKQVFLPQIETMVLGVGLVKFMAPYNSEGRNGRTPSPLGKMRRVKLMRQRINLSDSVIEEAFFDTPLYREHNQLDTFGRLPDESIILWLRLGLEKPKLVDRILAAVNKLLQQRCLMLKARTAADVDWGLVHTVRGTSGNVADVTEGRRLLHGQETDVFGDAVYQGEDKRPDAKARHKWHVTMRPGKSKKLDKDNNPRDALIDKVEKIKTGIRVKVEHPFRVIKRQVGFTKVLYRDLKKNTLQINTLFALSKLWIARHKLIVSMGMSGSKHGRGLLKAPNGAARRQIQACTDSGRVKWHKTKYHQVSNNLDHSFSEYPQIISLKSGPFFDH